MAPTTKDQEPLEKGLRELNLSNEELNKFEKAFKDPEFLKLFEEYAKEVSDPKVKAETDQYLRQLEEQGRGEDVYGKGVVLVAPKSAVVFKSKVMGAKDASEGPAASSRRDNLTLGQKVFINVCTSEKVDCYTLKQAKDANGRSGQQLSIPITMGPVRQGTDKQGQPAAVYDLVVHPETVEFATRSEPVMNTMAETAIDQVEKVSHSRLSRRWRRLNMRYKATEGCTEPPVQCIRTAEGGEAIGGRLRPQADVPGVDVPGARGPPSAAAKAEAAGASLTGTTGSAAVGAKAPASRSTFSFDRPKDKGAQRGGGVGAMQQPEGVKNPLQAGYRHDDGAVTPEWTLVYRGQTDLAAAWGDAGRGLTMDMQVPKELLVRVTLPGVSSAAGVDLDVGERRLTLKVPGKYHLDAPLPYGVEESKGKAKFDKASKQLEVALPVVPPPPPPPPPVAALRTQDAASTAVQELPDRQAAGTGRATEMPVTTGAAGDGNGGPTNEIPVSRVKPAAGMEAEGEGQPAAATSREAEANSVGAAPPSVGTEREGDVGGKAGDVEKEKELTLMTENERKWRELHERRAMEDAEATTGSESTAAVVAAAATVTTPQMSATDPCSASHDGSDDGVVSATDRAAAAEPEPTVLLHPRLRRDLAMELD
ncbi:hypothetical protein Vretifemale_6308 [Volvox reticuliferus]|uniref:PIH1 domain-containing protein 1 n=1 Tax=Volvox reticuliferus TaxID=1737510 RepID=A0A8J4C6V6_9CHLO|nr:hypothetical protein Vretifemale_6308 [Volvox reticuliferus]